MHLDMLQGLQVQPAVPLEDGSLRRGQDHAAGDPRCRFWSQPGSRGGIWGVPTQTCMLSGMEGLAGATQQEWEPRGDPRQRWGSGVGLRWGGGGLSPSPSPQGCGLSPSQRCPVGCHHGATASCCGTAPRHGARGWGGPGSHAGMSGAWTRRSSTPRRPRGDEPGRSSPTSSRRRRGTAPHPPASRDPGDALGLNSGGGPDGRIRVSVPSPPDAQLARRLQDSDAVTDREVGRLRSLWQLRLGDRWRLYRSQRPVPLMSGPRGGEAGDMAPLAPRRGPRPHVPVPRGCPSR